MEFILGWRLMSILVVFTAGNFLQKSLTATISVISLWVGQALSPLRGNYYLLLGAAAVCLLDTPGTSDISGSPSYEQLWSSASSLELSNSRVVLS